MRAIRLLLSIAGWIAKPKIGSTKIGTHADLILEMDVDELPDVPDGYKLKSCTILVNGFEVLNYQDEESKRIADAIEQLTKGTA